MRILQIANYVEGVGGISIQVKILHDKLRSEGFECDIVSTKGSLRKRIRSINWLLFHGKDYDVFHIHACSNRGFFPVIIGVSVGRLYGKRLILTYHGGGAEQFFRRSPRIVKYYLSKTDQNIVLSGFVGAIFDQYAIKYCIVPNILEMDTRRFRKRDRIRPKYISIRSFTDTYNIKCTLKAFKIVRAVFPEASLKLLGDGPLKEQLESFVREEDIKGVSFIGHIDNHCIYNYLDMADVMVSSSRYDNMPVSVLEGFNAGLLVIASRVGGVPYMIEDGYNGLLFEDNNANEMAENMINAILNQDSSLFMIENAYHSLDRYRWEVVKDSIIPIYRGA